MNLVQRKSIVATLGLLSLLIGLGGSATPAFAHHVTACVASPTAPISIVAGGSVVVKVTVTYTAFSSGDWPMFVTVTPSAGFSVNATAGPFTGISDSGTHTHVFFFKITNTNTAITSGTAPVTVAWKTQASESCGTLSLSLRTF